MSCWRERGLDTSCVRVDGFPIIWKIYEKYVNSLNNAFLVWLGNFPFQRPSTVTGIHIGKEKSALSPASLLLDGKTKLYSLLKSKIFSIFTAFSFLSLKKGKIINLPISKETPIQNTNKQRKASKASHTHIKKKKKTHFQLLLLSISLDSTWNGFNSA